MAGFLSLVICSGSIVDDAVTEAKHVCDANLGVAPDVIVTYGMEGMDSLPLQLCNWVAILFASVDMITLN